jgi:2-polyprenyl-3-methyl-5-hydroxy-6-metoxy-1,4-benzoquinol methylase
MDTGDSRILPMGPRISHNDQADRVEREAGSSLRLFPPAQRVSQDPCKNCGAEPLIEYPTVNSTMWYCPECRLYQKGHVAEAVEYNLEYHAGYRSRKRRKRWTALVRLSRIAGLLDSPQPRLLDVGCSLGYTVEAAAEIGWDAHGVDINPQVIDICRRRNLRCQVVPDHRLPYPDGHFDALTAWHVVEHVSNVSSTLDEWSRVLRRGGILAMETPDSSCLKLKWRGPSYRTFWAPEHVYTFDRQNLGRFAASAGLEVVPPPRVGAVGRLPWNLAAYAVGYQCLKGLQERIGLSKIFQLFCRKTDAVRPAITRRRAA